MVNDIIKTAANAALYGYAPIQVQGKMPIDKGWQKRANERPGYEEVLAWSDDRATGFGIVLGSPAGDGNVVIAIDIDLEDWDEVEEARGQLPVTPMAKKGEKGATLFYRCDPEIAKSRAYNDGQGRRMVDFLGVGRQTILPPSIHPGTDRPYEWAYGTGLVAPADLPLFGADELEKFEEGLACIGWDRTYGRKSDKGRVRLAAAGGEAVEGDIKWLNRLALDNIPKWIEDLDLYNGTWRGARYCAVNTQRASSTGRPDSKRKRNLSISPYGIKDFGTDETMSPLDLVMAFAGLDSDAAYIWLSERCDPKWNEKNDIQQLIDSGVRKALERVSVDSLKAKPKPKSDLELHSWNDNDCLQAPGLLGDLTRYISESMPGTPPSVALVAALGFVSHICARRYISAATGRLPLTLYMCATAGSTSGKDAPQKFVKRLLMRMETENDIPVYNYGSPKQRVDIKSGRGTDGDRIGYGPQRAELPIDRTNGLERLADVRSAFTSGAAVEATFYETAAPLVLIDEVGHWLGKVYDDRHGEPLAKYIKELSSLDEMVPQKSRAFDAKADEALTQLRTKKFRFPTMTIMGFGTLEHIEEHLAEHMVSDGFINRFLFVKGEFRKLTKDEWIAREKGRASLQDVPDEFIEKAMAIHTAGYVDADMFGQYENTADRRNDIFDRPEFIEIGMTDEAMSFYFEIGYGNYDGNFGKGIEETANGRFAELHLRIAGLACVSDGRAEIELSDLKWANRLMQVCNDNNRLLALEYVQTASYRSRTMSKREQSIRSVYEDAIRSSRGETVKRKKMPNVYEGSFVSKAGLLECLKRDLKSEYLQALREMKEAGCLAEMSMKAANGRELQCIQITDMWD